VLGYQYGHYFLSVNAKTACKNMSYIKKVRHTKQILGNKCVEFENVIILTVPRNN